MSIVASPVVPVQAAGQIAKAADMNGLASAAQFLLNRPITVGLGTTTTLTKGTSNAPVFSGTIVDTDGMWSATPDPTIFTVQRYGLYWAEVSAIVTCGTDEYAVSMAAFSGPNNPYVTSLNTNLFEAFRYGYADSAGPSYMRVSSLIAAPLFPGDKIEPTVTNIGNTTNGSSVCNMVVRWIGTTG
jgi:hypothetical protein